MFHARAPLLVGGEGKRWGWAGREIPARPVSACLYQTARLLHVKLDLIDETPGAILDFVDRDPAVGGVAVLVEGGRADHALVVLRRRDGRPHRFPVLLARRLDPGDDDVRRLKRIRAVRPDILVELRLVVGQE